MGWFSLFGRDNEDPYMGIFEQLMDPKYDQEIAYLQILSSAKTVAKEYFNHGRPMRNLLTTNYLPDQSVMAHPWLSDDG